jgi:hypothetical protein
VATSSSSSDRTASEGHGRAIDLRKALSPVAFWGPFHFEGSAGNRVSIQVSFDRKDDDEVAPALPDLARGPERLSGAASSPAVGWSVKCRLEYIEWANSVVAGLRQQRHFNACQLNQKSNTVARRGNSEKRCQLAVAFRLLVLWLAPRKLNISFYQHYSFRKADDRGRFTFAFRILFTGAVD